MPRLYVILAVAALAVFNVAQYRGWNLFAEDAGPQSRSANAARSSHK